VLTTEGTEKMSFHQKVKGVFPSLELLDGEKPKSLAKIAFAIPIPKLLPTFQGNFLEVPGMVTISKKNSQKKNRNDVHVCHIEQYEVAAGFPRQFSPMPISWVTISPPQKKIQKKKCPSITSTEPCVLTKEMYSHVKSPVLY